MLPGEICLTAKSVPRSSPTVNEALEWHCKKIGVLKPWMRVSDMDTFISREVMFKRLRNRYNYPKKSYMITEAPLPSTEGKAKVNVVHFDICNAVVRLLTDPRFWDQDFLAVPPAHVDVIGEINTGRAYRSTHKTLITGPNQMLVPLLFCIDAAVTHQFDKLPVTPVKMSLGIFNRKARDREEAWVTVGCVPAKAHELNAMAESVFAQSNHVAFDSIVGARPSETEEAGDNSQAWEKIYFSMNGNK